ncbi:MAG: antibiotic biosynthesis monooxygenase [Microbacteriaceae bacterium]|nr:antibiotic biosynthesis monooxygenase [Microbacteriaceae bacterium]
MLGLFATLTVKPGQLDTALAMLAELATPTRGEPGCHLYVFGPGRQPDTIAMMERYDDKDALKAHFASPHFLAIGSRLNELLDGQPASTRFTEVVAPGD